MAEKSLKLEIVTPESLALSEDVDIVTVPGGLGEFGVLPGHTPFLTTVKPGKLTFESSGRRGVMAIGWGYAEVRPYKVLILTEMAKRPAEIARDQVRDEYEELVSRLRQPELTPEEREAILKHFERIKAQLKVLEVA